MGEPLYVACLCAQWCGICREWRAGFAALAAQLDPALDVRWAWIDVEDCADALGDWEPDNFPVIAVQRGARLLHCAPLPQQPGLWLRLIEQLACDAAPPSVAQPSLPDLRPLFPPLH